MAHVDDLVEPSPEQIVLTAVRTLLRPHRITLPSSKRQQGITAKGADQFARSQPSRPPKPAKANTLKSQQKPQNQGASGFFTGDERMAGAGNAYAEILPRAFDLTPQVQATEHRDPISLSTNTATWSPRRRG